MTGYFKKTIIISLLGHITVFSVFSLSFGKRMRKLDYGSVLFWAGLLRNSEIPAFGENNRNQLKEIFTAKSKIKVMDRTIKDSLRPFSYDIKPSLRVSFGTEKADIIEKTIAPKAVFKTQEPSIIFYPLLPYSFTLYFKDRQIAHVELMFRIEPLGRKNAVVVKRKISSGNLEVDLLSIRYIENYLLMQEKNFVSDKWQIAKIDLSAKKDKPLP